MDYFNGRRMKILSPNLPSYIKAEFGSRASMWFGNAKGEVETKIVKRNGGSYINLNFNFLKEYAYGLIAASIIALIFYILAWVQALAQRGDLPLGMMWATFIALIILGSMGMLVSYDVSLTRRRFMEEFNMFIQSLVSKKDQD
jgi:hypothetical protein